MIESAMVAARNGNYPDALLYIEAVREMEFVSEEVMTHLNIIAERFRGRLPKKGFSIINLAEDKVLENTPKTPGPYSPLDGSTARHFDHVFRLMAREPGALQTNNKELHDPDDLHKH